MSDSIYSKLAKGGWLGTKAQVADEYGKPAWKDEEEKPDPMSMALKNAMKKKENQNESGS